MVVLRSVASVEADAADEAKTLAELKHACTSRAGVSFSRPVFAVPSPPCSRGASHFIFGRVRVAGSMRLGWFNACMRACMNLRNRPPPVQRCGQKLKADYISLCTDLPMPSTMPTSTLLEHCHRPAIECGPCMHLPFMRRWHALPHTAFVCACVPIWCMHGRLVTAHARMH